MKKQEEGKYKIDLGLKMTKHEETIYKDNEVNSRMLILSVRDGKVHLILKLQRLWTTMTS